MAVVEYNHYQSDHLQVGPVQSQDYGYKIPLSYDSDHFVLEGCQLTSTRGIQAINFKSGVEFVIKSTLDQHNPEHLRFLYIINRFHQDTYDFIETNNYTYKKLNPIINYINGQYVLILFLRNQNFEQTIFTNEQGNFVPWHLLENSPITFIPKIHIKKMYLNQNGINYHTMLHSACIK
jgi:hypothetical protein